MTSKHRYSLIVSFLVCAIAVVFFVVVSRRATFRAADTDANVATNTRSASAKTNLVASRSATTNRLTSLQPLFPIGHETAFAKWTDADGKDTNVIKQLAHNPLEYARMVEENPRIFRRQLVYLNQTAASVFEKAKLTGDLVQHLTLPGLDGREFQFEIVKRESASGLGSSRQGMFSGHLAGNNDSLVTLAFEDGRQAFTILSPKDNIFIVGEPRDDAQVIVKEIDPDTYGVGPMTQEEVPTPQPNNK